MKFSRKLIPASNVGSLTWCGDTLVDWVGGIQVFHLDGKHEKSRLHWGGFGFDAAVAATDGRHVVIYKCLGTKALLLRDGEILRELNRSYYFAEVYEYPVCVWNTSDGRTLIAHCPEEYCRMDIEDAETGERLTNGDRKPEDFFHSRLLVNATGTRILSAGWMWHPLDGVVHYDVAEALRSPSHLDSVDNRVPNTGEINIAEAGSACWQTADRLLLGGVSDEDEPLNDEAKEAKERRLNANGIAIYDVGSKKYIRSVILGEVPGTMMPVCEQHVVCFYQHPKLISLVSGEVLMEWDDLDSGTQNSSILGDSKLPPIALDAENNRFAVAGPSGITVVQIDLSA
ncbi:MAG: hypothetical protein WBQ94_05125 [Terracidiphilus sp.]